MLKTVVHGEVTGGKLIPDRPDFLKQSFACREGKRCTVTVGDYKTTRSLRQNAYYWAVVVKMIAGHVGDNPKSIHRQLCAMLATPEVVSTKLIAEVVVQGHTSYMSTVEMEEYLRDVRAWALEFLGLVIPKPNETEFDYE